jgi:hypothetical protein
VDDLQNISPATTKVGIRSILEASRTAAPIKGEAPIYDALANSVCRPRSRHKAMLATGGIQQEPRDVVNNEPGHRWAQQTGQGKVA